MIFQEPMTALNPLYTVEKQVAEVLKQHNRLEEADTNSAMKIGKAIISPAEMSVHFFRNDWRGALPIITTFLVILAIHQTDNADSILGLIANKYAAIGFLVLVLNLIFWNIFSVNIDFTETTRLRHWACCMQTIILQLQTAHVLLCIDSSNTINQHREKHDDCEESG